MNSAQASWKQRWILILQCFWQTSLQKLSEVELEFNFQWPDIWSPASADHKRFGNSLAKDAITPALTTINTNLGAPL